MTKSDDFYSKVFDDFPDGFLMSYDTVPNSESDDGVIFHVYDIKVHPSTDTGKPRCLLMTLEVNPGKVFDIEIDDYEIIDHEPTQAQVIVEGQNNPFTWSDNLSDEMRIIMRNERRGGVNPSDEEDPPLRRNGESTNTDTSDIEQQMLDIASTPDDTEPDATVTITPEQADADPNLRARAQIAELLKDDE